MNELPQAKRLQSDMEYGQSEEADVKLEPSILSGVEGYIDNVAYAVPRLPQQLEDGDPSHPSSCHGTVSSLSPICKPSRANQATRLSINQKDDS